MLVIIHLVGLHEHSSSNPIGIPIVTDRIFFTPYFAIKDVLGILVVLLFYIIVIFYLPLSYIEHYDNSNIANPLVTPEHIVPE
jgi:ubiquinol-cytochrome c reductase cytochrome b subunit